MTVCDLTAGVCQPCADGTGALGDLEINSFLKDLPEWRRAGESIIRRFEFKGFAKAVQMANLVAWHSDKMGHHADISFGWGYCEVTYTSHEAGGLTQNDFICAAKLNALVM